MDENKIVPVPEDEAEKVDAAAEEIDEVVDENDGFEDEYSTDDSFVMDNGSTDIEDFYSIGKKSKRVDDDDAEDEDETDEDASPKKKKKKMKLGGKIAIGILVVLIGFIIYGMISIYIATKPPKVDFDANSMTVGSTNISASEFFFYCSSVQGSSVDELKQGGIDLAIMYNVLYEMAQKEGFKLSDEEKASVDAQITSMKNAAVSAGMTEDEYIASNIAKGFTFEMYKAFLEKDAYVNSYFTKKVDSFEKKYEGDAGLKVLEDAYNKSKTEYDVADFSYAYFIAGEGAEEKANSVAEAVKGGQSFDEALKAADETISAITITTETKATLEKSFNSDAALWLYKTNDKNEYVNGTGAVEVFKDDSFVYVVYVNNAPAKNEVYPVTANYIKIAVNSNTSVKTEEMNKLVAKKTADKILAEFLATDKSAEKLTEIAEKYSKDDKSVTSSTFEGVTNDGSLDAALESWLFDDARKEKDVTTELIEADGAYYIVYYVEKAEHTVWYDTTLNTLLNEDISGFRNNLLAEGKKNFTTNEDSINEVMDLISYLSSSSASSYGY